MRRGYSAAAHETGTEAWRDLSDSVRRPPRIWARPAVSRKGGPRHVRCERVRRHASWLDLLPDAISLRSCLGQSFGPRWTATGAPMVRCRLRANHGIARARARVGKHRHMAL